MASNTAVTSPPVEIFKALSDPIRWSIMTQMAIAGELACITLESTLPVSKPTISYHTKILNNAGLITVRKSGRNYYYSLRRDVLHGLLDSLWDLAPQPRPVVGNEKGAAPKGRRQKRADVAGLGSLARRRDDGHDDADEAVILTW